MPAQPAVEIPGLEEWRRDLKASANPRAYRTEFRKEERTIAVKVATVARTNAAGLGGPYRHFAGFIAGRATNRGASIGLRGNKANATFWGAKKHTGWYATGRYSKSTGRQHPEWVGASWVAGGPGGPHAINPAVAELSGQIPDWYGKAVDRVAHKAFPIAGGEAF